MIFPLIGSGGEVIGFGGRRIVEGEKDIKVFGEMYKLRAKVEVLNGFSKCVEHAGVCKSPKSCGFSATKSHLPQPIPLARLKPLFDSMVPIVMLVFFIPGLAYGLTVGRVRTDHDVVRISSEAVATTTRTAPVFKRSSSSAR